MKFNMIAGICLLVLAFLPDDSVAAGRAFSIDSIEYLPPNTQYRRLGQETREANYTESEQIFINYTSRGQQRRLRDDDGLATLFIYHRNIAGRVYNRELKLSDPIPQPTANLNRALDMLKKTYEKYADNPGLSAEIRNQLRAAAARIPDVKRALSRASTIEDLERSGLQSLINDTLQIHAYDVESPIGSDNLLLTEVMGRGAPATLTSANATRCRDSIALNWSSVSGSLSASSQPRGTGGPRNNTPAVRGATR